MKGKSHDRRLYIEFETFNPGLGIKGVGGWLEEVVAGELRQISA